MLYSLLILTGSNLDLPLKQTKRCSPPEVRQDHLNHFCMKCSFSYILISYSLNSKFQEQSLTRSYQDVKINLYFRKKRGILEWAYGLRTLSWMGVLSVHNSGACDQGWAWASHLSCEWESSSCKNLTPWSLDEPSFGLFRHCTSSWKNTRIVVPYQRSNNTTVPRESESILKRVTSFYSL